MAPAHQGSACTAGEQDVELYMYDLSNGMATTLAPFLGKQFDGLWHTSVVVFGQEYFFNGDLVHITPGETLYGKPARIVTIGRTPCTKFALHRFLADELRTVFNRSSYNALCNNCNHFADHMCMYLCQRHVPDHILQQPEEIARLPALQFLKPFVDKWLDAKLAAPSSSGSSPREDEANTRGIKRPGMLFEKAQLQETHVSHSALPSIPSGDSMDKDEDEDVLDVLDLSTKWVASCVGKRKGTKGMMSLRQSFADWEVADEFCKDTWMHTSRGPTVRDTWTTRHHPTSDLLDRFKGSLVPAEHDTWMHKRNGPTVKDSWVRRVLSI